MGKLRREWTVERPVTAFASVQVVRHRGSRHEREAPGVKGPRHPSVTLSAVSVREAPTDSESEPESERATEDSGLAHLAAVSFLASRLAPAAGYWVALPGGVAISRAAARHGLRTGTGVSLAALAQTVAVMGPARLSIPFTQAVTAPLVGWLEARDAGPLVQAAVVAVIRFALALISTAFFIWVILGGLDAYAGGYTWVTSRAEFLPQTDSGVLGLSVFFILAWTLFASPVQVAVYRRGMRKWPAHTAPDADAAPAPPGEAARRHLDPRAVTAAAAVAFALLLLSADTPLLIAVGVWLAIAWFVAQPETAFVPVGAALAALLGITSFLVGVIADLGLEASLERGVRAAMLVAVATWFRAAAGTGGIREVSRRIFGRVDRVLPGAREATRMLADLGSGSALVPTARELSTHLHDVRHRPAPLVDAVTGWVAEESRRFRPAPPAPAPRLEIQVIDVFIVLLALSPAVVLVTGVAMLGSA
jgi:hypothetical protein